MHNNLLEGCILQNVACIAMSTAYLRDAIKCKIVVHWYLDLGQGQGQGQGCLYEPLRTLKIWCCHH